VRRRESSLGKEWFAGSTVKPARLAAGASNEFSIVAGVLAGIRRAIGDTATGTRETRRDPYSALEKQ
jgi:hypothetical protein